MSPRTLDLLEPRKTPVQARSTASVEAILEATIQVLLAVGKENLTTTKVAARAGVSIGTLYQYYPNKSSLLQAVLTRHLDAVTETVERACIQQRGQPLQPMIAAVITAFLNAKMANPKTSVALYSVSADVDGLRIAQERREQLLRWMVKLLTTSSEKLTRDPQLVATILQSAMTGVAHRLLESPTPEKLFQPLLQELIQFANAYLQANIAH